jgi:hypothetical protein
MFDKDDWRRWTNYVLFMITMSACTGFLTFYMSTIGKQIDKIEATMMKNDALQALKLDEVVKKTDTVCSKVAEHDMLLHFNYPERDRYYKSPKLGFGGSDK